MFNRRASETGLRRPFAVRAVAAGELIARLKPLETAIPAEEWNANPGRMPGGLSRWSRGKDKDTE